MRVVLVGAAADRDRLRRALLNSGLEIAGEAATVEDARWVGRDGDAFLVAPSSLAQTRFPTARPVETPDDGVGALDRESLTPREFEVLRWLALGLPNKAIAAKLGISDQTVKFHVAAIIGKLGAANRTDAVRRAARRGLIDL